MTQFFKYLSTAMSVLSLIASVVPARGERVEADIKGTKVGVFSTPKDDSDELVVVSLGDRLKATDRDQTHGPASRMEWVNREGASPLHAVDLANRDGDCAYYIEGVVLGGKGSGKWRADYDTRSSGPKIRLQVNNEGMSDDYVAMGPKGGTLTAVVVNGVSGQEYPIKFTNSGNGTPQGQVGFNGNSTSVQSTFRGSQPKTTNLTGLAIGGVTITAACTKSSDLKATVNATVVGVARIEWKWAGGSGSATGTNQIVYLPIGEKLSLHAISTTPDGEIWPSGKPEWSSTNVDSKTVTVTKDPRDPSKIAAVFSNASTSVTSPAVITAACGTSKASVKIVVVRVNEIQWYNGTEWQGTVRNRPVYVPVGNSIRFRAIPEPADRPAWTVTGGTQTPIPGGSRDTIEVQFSRVSSSKNTPDLSTVKASCGTSEITAYVLVWNITTRTEQIAPDDINNANDNNRARRTVGVGEHVACSTTPAVPATWSLQGGGRFSRGGTNTSQAMLVAPGNAAQLNVTATANGRSSVVRFTVLEPNIERAVILPRPAPWPWGPTDQGVGMYLGVTVGPTTVSFGFVSCWETPNPVINRQGWFLNHPGFSNAMLQHRPNLRPTRLTAANPTTGESGNRWFDDANFYGAQQPWSWGTLTWTIPMMWQTAGAARNTTSIPQRTQVHTIVDATGESTETKLGHTVSRRVGQP